MNISSSEEMKQLGKALGAVLLGGDTIELIGDVGAGKTTLTKGIALGLLIDDDVASPSFTISRTYPARDKLQLSHFDFYRLNDPGILAIELAELAYESNNITVVEWADIVADVLPADRLQITITADQSDEQARQVVCVFLGDFARKNPAVAELFKDYDHEK